MAREVFREASGFYRVDFTADMIGWAEDRLSRWNDGGFKKMTDPARGTRAGVLGEAIFQWALPRAKFLDSKDYDFALDGFTVEVKTHVTKYAPLPTYQQLLPVERIHDGCDTYAFVTLSSDMTHGWLVGWLMAREISTVGSFRKQGRQQDVTKFLYKCDCWEIPFGRLRLFSSVDVS